MTQHLFHKHILQLVREYHNSIIINLVSKTRKIEDALSEAYLGLLSLSQKIDPRIKGGAHYCSYDFHNETTGEKYYKVQELID
jgi:hypothetical protein